MHNRRAAIAYTYAGKKIGHALYFKFSFMALLYSRTVQGSEEDFFLIASGFMMCDWKKKNQYLNFCSYTFWTETQPFGTRLYF